MQNTEGLDCCNRSGGVSEDPMIRGSIISSIDNRLFYLNGDIDARSCGELAYSLILINIEDDKRDDEEVIKRRPIRIYINSNGGSAYDMWMLADTILGSVTPVHTYCTGYAMSAAFIVFLAGHRRYMSVHATLMYHQINCTRTGKYQDLVDDREQIDHMNEMIEDFVIDQTTLTKDCLLTIREKKMDVYFTVEDAERLMIIDEVLF